MTAKFVLRIRDQFDPAGPSGRLKSSNTPVAGGDAGDVGATVQEYESVAVLPAASLACTSNVCGPGESPVNVSFVALVHRSYGAPSRRQRTDDTARLTVKAIVPDVCVVFDGGFDELVIATLIAAGAMSTPEKVPVSVGAPAANGYGGYTGFGSVERNGDVPNT